MKNNYPITWLTEMAKVQLFRVYKWLKNGKVSLRKYDDEFKGAHFNDSSNK